MRLIHPYISNQPHVRALVHRYGEHIMQGLTGIVGGSSKTQSAVGILSAGLVKSVKYGSAKLGKMWEGR